MVYTTCIRKTTPFNAVRVLSLRDKFTPFRQYMYTCISAIAQNRILCMYFYGLPFTN